MAFVEQRRHDLRRRTVDEARGGEHIEDLLALGFTQRPGGRWTGLAGARELTSDDGRRSPVTRPVLGRPAPRPTCARKRLDRHQERVPCSRFNPSSPATFPCTSRIVCAVCNSCSRRATCASSARTFASSGVRSAGFAPRFFAANSRSEPLRRALRQAVRCELYNPSRRSRRPTVNGGAKLVHPGGAKLVHLTLCGTRCWGVVPVVHRKGPALLRVALALRGAKQRGRFLWTHRVNHCTGG